MWRHHALVRPHQVSMLEKKLQVNNPTEPSQRVQVLRGSKRGAAQKVHIKMGKAKQFTKKKAPIHRSESSVSNEVLNYTMEDDTMEHLPTVAITYLGSDLHFQRRPLDYQQTSGQDILALLDERDHENLASDARHLVGVHNGSTITSMAAPHACNTLKLCEHERLTLRVHWSPHERKISIQILRYDGCRFFLRMLIRNLV